MIKGLIKMKWILFFVLSCMFISAHAEFTRGEGKFRAEDYDNYEFIKSQLIYEGFLDIISKEIEKMGLSKEIFWAKFNERLNEKLVSIESSLKTQMNITPESSSKDIEEFNKKMRLKRLKLRERFGGLYSVVPKWVVKKISRSSANPDLRYISIEGKVNTTKLSKLYYEFVKGRQQSEYGTLYLNVEYKLNGFSYSDLEIKNENDFSGVVNRNWVEWFEKNKPQNIANIELLSESNKESLESYLKLPQKRMLVEIPEVFINSLLLDIKVELTRVYYNKETEEYRFSYKGAAYLRDLQSNLIVDTYEFSEKTKSYQVREGINLANVVANQTYQLVKDQFRKVQKDIKELTESTQLKSIYLIKYANIDEVKAFIELIENRGIKYSIKARLDSINQSRSNISVYFDGELSELKALLISLQSAKKDLLFELVDTNNDLGIKFNQRVDVL